MSNTTAPRPRKFDSSQLDPSQRRQLKGKLVNPRAQLRFSLFLVAGALLILVLFSAVVIFALNRTIVSLELSEGLQPAISLALRKSFTLTLTLVFILAGLLSALAVLLGIHVSHRVFGPLVPLRRHIDELKRGNFASRVQLRKNDELVELQDSLNDLAESLEARYGSSGKKV